jgi:hypothetical protein
VCKRWTPERGVAYGQDMTERQLSATNAALRERINQCRVDGNPARTRTLLRGGKVVTSHGNGTYASSAFGERREAPRDGHGWAANTAARSTTHWHEDGASVRWPLDGTA